MSKTNIPAVIFVSTFVSTFVIRDMHHIRLPVVCSENRPKAGIITRARENYMTLYITRGGIANQPGWE